MHATRPVVVLCDLIADLALHVESFPIAATDLKKLTYIDLGPGGACNAAIMARRLGLPVACLGEVGADRFGDAVVRGLRAERIDVSGVVVDPDVRTPVAGVLVDPRAEPAYLGYPGTLRLTALPEAWLQPLQVAQAVYADGWAEHAGVAAMILAAFRIAQAAGAPVFFDPGPGNPALDNAWHLAAAALATVVSGERAGGRAADRPRRPRGRGAGAAGQRRQAWPWSSAGERAVCWPRRRRSCPRRPTR